MAASRRGSRILLFALLGLCLSGASPARPSVSPTPPPATASAAAGRFDPEAATRDWLARISPAKKARSDAYFEGGYWLHLWGFLYGIATMGLLLAGGWSARMRDLAERMSRRPAVQTYLYWVQFLLATVVLLFPLTVYEGFLRERRYGLATQTFWPWMGDRLKELGLSLVMGGLTVVALYAVVRRAPRTWWIWGALTATALWAFTVLIAPVFVFPLFNRFTPLSDDAVRGPILSLARANDIPASDVYVSDASRQTTRVSANVSGLFRTLRITLNDNLLKRCSLAEIESVMGHEMGHYVLHHLEKGIVFTGILIVAGFLFLRASFDAIARRYGARWGIRGPADAAGMPLFAILAATYLFMMTPVINSITRVQEAEADLFGLNASGQPDGFAEVTLKLGEYRKLEPGPLEEVLFYDHPSGRTRILMAMRWKAEHLPPR
ncbi:MAG TPA: M48 family metallopeptidase [Thermoanaerobaculia bacterium]|nr:M48 family metallopeptidase [Thermoanaerobaculia bacterium]